MKSPRLTALVLTFAGSLTFAASLRADDLTWIPPDCTGFVHIKFAALWDSPVGRDIRKAINAADPNTLSELEKKLGLSLSEIESLTIVLPEVRNDPRDDIVVRVTTSSPYNRVNVLNALNAEQPDDEDKKITRPQTLYRIRAGGLLHFSGEKSITILSDREGGVQLLGKLLNRKAEGPLSPALKMAGGDHQFIAALDVTQLPAIPPEELPPPLRAMRDIRFAVLTGRLAADRLHFDASLSFARPGLADEGAKAVADGRKMLLDEMQKELAQAMKDEKENRLQVVLLKEGIRAATDAKIDSKESVVRIAAQMAISEAMTKLLADGTDAIRLASSRSQSQNNLKQIGIAMHNYHDVNNMLPPAAICDANGKPLLSWRVAVLPYLEQEALYKQFKLDEPWDSEHNKKLIGQMPKIYQLPGDAKKHELPSTYYQTLVGNDAMFELRRGTGFAKITDGLSNTLMVVEAADAVPWTKPDDISYGPKQTPKLGYFFRSSSNALFGDGSVRALKKSMKPEILHLLIQRNDGQVIPEIP